MAVMTERSALRPLVAGDRIEYGDSGDLRTGTITAVHNLRDRLQVVEIDGKTVVAVESIDERDVVAGPVGRDVAHSLAQAVILGRDPHLGTSIQLQVLALALLASETVYSPCKGH